MSAMSELSIIVAESKSVDEATINIFAMFGAALPAKHAWKSARSLARRAERLTVCAINGWDFPGYVVTHITEQ